MTNPFRQPSVLVVAGAVTDDADRTAGFALADAHIRAIAAMTALIVVSALLGALSLAWMHPRVAAAGRPLHRILFHVASDDPGAMAHAISAADNAMKFYGARGESVAIEIVANGSGVRMMRADTSPVAPSIAYLRTTYPTLTLSACGTTLNLMKAREGHDIALLPGVRVTPAGIARIIDLEEHGWSYVRS